MSDEITIIRPYRPSVNLTWHEYWRYRHVFTHLVQRDVHSQFDSMYFGILWIVARPLLMMALFHAFKRYSGAELGIGEVAYPLYLFLGLILWFYFVDAAAQAAGSLKANANLMTKIYFPRLLTPLSACVSQLVMLVVAAVPLTAMMFFYKEAPDWHLLLLPIVIAQVLLLAFAVGTLFAGLSIGSRDGERALSFILYMGLFVSPVIYSYAMIPEEARWIFDLNPMVGSLMGTRVALFGDAKFTWVQF
jgi:lipopolysaccharide transport system permease protein